MKVVPVTLSGVIWGTGREHKEQLNRVTAIQGGLDQHTSHYCPTVTMDRVGHVPKVEQF